MYLQLSFLVYLCNQKQHEITMISFFLILCLFFSSLFCRTYQNKCGFRFCSQVAFLSIFFSISLAITNSTATLLLIVTRSIHIGPFLFLTGEPQSSFNESLDKLLVAVMEAYILCEIFCTVLFREFSMVTIKLQTDLSYSYDRNFLHGE